MAIDTIDPGKQLYSLLVTHCDSKQTVAAQYNSSAILTTDHATLMEYTRQQVLHFGTRRIYIVATVSPMTVFEDGTPNGYSVVVSPYVEEVCKNSY